MNPSKWRIRKAYAIWYPRPFWSVLPPGAYDSPTQGMEFDTWADAIAHVNTANTFRRSLRPGVTR